MRIDVLDCLHCVRSCQLHAQDLFEQRRPLAGACSMKLTLAGGSGDTRNPQMSLKFLACVCSRLRQAGSEAFGVGSGA